MLIALPRDLGGAARRCECRSCIAAHGFDNSVIRYLFIVICFWCVLPFRRQRHLRDDGVTISGVVDRLVNVSSRKRGDTRQFTCNGLSRRAKDAETDGEERLMVNVC